MGETLQRKKREWRDTDRFSLSIQMIGLVVILLVVSAVLMRVYAHVVRTSMQAEVLNKSVLLCRNTAELYRQNGQIEDIADAYGVQIGDPDALTAYFDRDMQPAAEKDAWFVLQILSEEETQGVRTIKMQVTHEGEAVYDLDVSVCAPEGGR